MNIFFYVLFFFVGACFVSCGNCIFYRVRRGLDWVRGRSICESCGKPLRVWELVPVVSCLVLRGRCSRCGFYFGYTHAETEALGGLACVLLCLGHDDPYSCLMPLLSFGLTFCVMCWWRGRKYKDSK